MAELSTESEEEREEHEEIITKANLKQRASGFLNTSWRGRKLLRMTSKPQNNTTKIDEGRAMIAEAESDDNNTAAEQETMATLPNTKQIYENFNLSLQLSRLENQRTLLAALRHVIRKLHANGETIIFQVPDAADKIELKSQNITTEPKDLLNLLELAFKRRNGELDINEWDLVCDKEIYTTLALVLLAVGGLIGNYVFGYLQDSIGRRPVFFIYLFIELLFGIATAFAQDVWTWCVLRFGVGFTVPAVLGTPYVLAIELVGPARRTTCTILTNVAYSVGLIVLSAVVYFVRDWRQLALATSIPFLSFFLYWWVLPESPRWLLAQGRFEEAEKILKKMARVNGKALPANYMVHLRRKYHVERYIEKKARKHEYGVLDLVRTPNLRCKTLIVTFIWFTNTCVYVGLTYYAPVLGGDEFLNFFLAGAVELPVYVFLWPSMDCWGRRWVLCFSMVTGGAACLGTFFFENDSRVKLGLFCVGKMGICSSFVVLPLMASELYPTVVRGLGMSTSSILAMLGPVFVPVVVHMGKERSSVALTAMGTLMVVSGVLSLLLPETLHQHLPQTLEDGEMFGKSWSWRQWITCCPPRDDLKKEDISTSKESPIRSLIQHHIRDPKPVTVVEGTTPDFMHTSTATITEDTISEVTTPEHTLKITVV